MRVWPVAVGIDGPGTGAGTAGACVAGGVDGVGTGMVASISAERGDNVVIEMTDGSVMILLRLVSERSSEMLPGFTPSLFLVSCLINDSVDVSLS